MAIEQQQRKNKSNEKAFFKESPAQKVSAGITTNGASPAGVAWAGSSKLLPSRRVSRILPAYRVSRRLPVSRQLTAYPNGFPYPASLPRIPPAAAPLPLRPPSPSYRRLHILCILWTGDSPSSPCHCGLPLPPIAGSGAKHHLHPGSWGLLPQTTLQNLSKIGVFLQNFLRITIASDPFLFFLSFQLPGCLPRVK